VIRRLANLAALAALAVGVALAVRRFQRLAEATSPAGLARTARSLVGEARDFASEVRAGTAEREAELRGSLFTEPAERRSEAGAERSGLALPGSSQAHDAAPALDAPTARGGGWQPGDEHDPLYDF
jgi:hypothetical protein